MPLNKPKHAIYATLGWLALIWTVSSTPAEKMPSLRILNWDKLAHVGVYLILGLLVSRSIRLSCLNRSQARWVWLAAFLSAGLDELHQLFIPGRSVNIWDFLANALGLGLAVLLCQKQHDRSQKPLS